jgi:hypothetical protein
MEVAVALPRVVFVSALAIFGGIGVAALVKKASHSEGNAATSAKVEVPHIANQSKPYEPIPEPTPPPLHPPPPLPPPPPPPKMTPAPAPVVQADTEDDFPNVDRIHQLFTTGPLKLPIVETLQYTSSVPWLKGKPAWVADYASHYGTSRHFIARSLNGKPDYFSQKISTGNRFNVFRKDKNINFYLLIDASRCKMGFYYVDLDTQERVLLKTYRVSLGRLDSNSASGCLTPLGTYSLGSKVAIYKPGVMGYFQDQTIEMIQVFGTRWIPFDQELEGASAPAKGYGLHGLPWVPDAQTGQFVEYREGLGRFDSDGCIRLSIEDIEELFAIVITKPTYVMIVKDFHEARLPGKEVATPTR